MHLCCPACGFKSPIEVFAADKDARVFAALMGRVPPPLADGVLRYLSLFAPARHAMTFGRGRTLLEPLVQMIEAGRITRARREWIVSLAGFEAGLRQMIESRAKLTLPLKSHGYLLEVLAGAVNQAEGKAEAAQIEQLRHTPPEQRGESASEASQWDADRARNQARRAAVVELQQQVASCKRLKTPISHPALEQQLQHLGHSAEVIAFAFSKVPLE